MGLIQYDLEFTANLMKHVMVEIPQWRPDLKRYEKDPPQIPFTLNMKKKINQAMGNNYEDAYIEWSNNNSETKRNFKNLIDNLMAVYSENDYEEVSFFEFCMKIAVMGYCGYLSDIDGAPEYAMKTILRIIKIFRSKNDFTDDSYIALDLWAKHTLTEISTGSKNRAVNSLHDSSSGFESNMSYESLNENNNYGNKIVGLKMLNKSERNEHKNTGNEDKNAVTLSTKNNCAESSKANIKNEPRAFGIISWLKSTISNPAHELYRIGICSEKVIKKYAERDEKNGNILFHQETNLSSLDDPSCSKRKIDTVDEENNSASEPVNTQRPLKRQNSSKTDGDKNNKEENATLETTNPQPPLKRQNSSKTDENTNNKVKSATCESTNPQQLLKRQNSCKTSKDKNREKSETCKPTNQKRPLKRQKSLNHQNSGKTNQDKNREKQKTSEPTKLHQPLKYRSSSNTNKNKN